MPTERTEEQRALYWKVLEDCRKSVAAWPYYVKRAFPPPLREDDEE